MCWKNANLEGLPKNQRKDFVVKLIEDHKVQIFGQLGSPKDELCLNFLNGIFFTPLFVNTTVPHLQKVFMADACH